MSAHQASGAGEVQRPPLCLRLCQLWVAVQVGIWLCRLPRRLWRQSLPGFLHQLTPAPGHTPRHFPLEMEPAVRIVRRVCRLRGFRDPRFPQACLRQALALYHFLGRLGYPVEIHFGVYKAEETLRGHSWVTVDGVPVAEPALPPALQCLYTFPPTAPFAPEACCGRAVSDDDTGGRDGR